MSTPFHEKLQTLIDDMVHDVYRLTKLFPKEEIYGSVSQVRRAALSVALNYTEGFARQRRAVNRNFVETAYGSLQETKYILRFAIREKWLQESDVKRVLMNMEEIGAMLWGVIGRLKKDDA